MLFDSHCHLNFEAFKSDLPQVISRARGEGVTNIVVPGTDLASSWRAVEIANEYEGVWAAIGIHPHHAKDPSLVINDSLKKELSKLASQNRVVAVGEIGMDYHVYNGSKYPDVRVTPEQKEKQKELFKLQFQLAIDHKLSTILHCREAHEDMIELIRTFQIDNFEAKTSDTTTSNESYNNSRKIPHSTLPPSSASVKNTSPNRETELYHSLAGGLPPGVFHCWGGSKKHLRTCLSLGYYIGFDGNITYSSDWAQFVNDTPIERLLIETDSPYLTPVPHRGTRNEPSHVKLVATAVAEYKQLSPDEVIRKTTENAKTLFGI